MIFVQAVGQTLAVSSDFQLALVFPPTQEMAVRDVRSLCEVRNYVELNWHLF